MIGHCGRYVVGVPAVGVVDAVTVLPVAGLTSKVTRVAVIRTLAQYRVTHDADGRRLKEVDEPRLCATGRASPQPFLPSLEAVEWYPAQRLPPYRPRRKRAVARQEHLFDLEDGVSAG